MPENSNYASLIEGVFSQSFGTTPEGESEYGDILGNVFNTTFTDEDTLGDAGEGGDVSDEWIDNAIKELEELERLPLILLTKSLKTN